MQSFLIKNVNVVLPDTIKKLDILIENGKIVKINELIDVVHATILNCSNLFLLPGLVDMHVHLREPGFCEKETIKTGCEAAAAGGFTTICCMPNTNPPIDCSEVINFVKSKAKNCKMDVKIIAAITKNLVSLNLVDFEKLSKDGAIAFSNDGFCLEDENVLAKALIESQKNNRFIISHCENSKLTQGGLVNQGKISNILNLKGISNFSESSIVKSNINLAFKLNCKIHIAHVSVKESVQELSLIKNKTNKISAETCPHYFFFNENELLTQNANFKINPPLRSEADRLAIENAIIDGTIDCISTDHAPHTVIEKQNFLTAPNGAIGLETSLAAVLTHFFHTKKLNLNQIVKIMSINPSRILNIPPNEISVNKPANFIIVDVNRPWIVNSSSFKSKSCNSPFLGRTLKGKVLKTFYKGELIYNID